MNLQGVPTEIIATTIASVDSASYDFEASQARWHILQGTLEAVELFIIATIVDNTNIGLATRINGDQRIQELLNLRR
ncbi:hypothetical protein DAD99_04760 [Pseudarthrobacter sp. AB1]|nr:hypothetical protein [Pseudarthrobacter sp. AB1]